MEKFYCIYQLHHFYFKYYRLGYAYFSVSFINICKIVSNLFRALKNYTVVAKNVHNNFAKFECSPTFQFGVIVWQTYTQSDE